MRRRVLIGVAGSAMVAVAVLGAYALFGREADAAPLEECEWVEAFHIDFTAEVAQPNAGGGAGVVPRGAEAAYIVR